MSLTASITNHARWFSGSHSRSDGDINNNCSRSHSMKFWGMPRSFLNPPDRPGFMEQPHMTAIVRRGRAGALALATWCSPDTVLSGRRGIHPVVGVARLSQTLLERGASERCLVG